MMEVAMYFGGMILSDMESAYHYEKALKAFLEQRIALFEDSTTFWGKHNNWIFQLEPAMGFSGEAYYYVPSDPLVVFPDYHRAHLLKRRYLNRIRMQIIRLKKQGKGPMDYVNRYYAEDKDQSILNHINRSRAKHGKPPVEKFW